MDRWRLPAGYSGSALVAERDDLCWQAAAGLADPDTGRACTVETPLNIASLGKMFVASTAVSLGVDLDRPVAPVVPELAAATGADVTLRHLLSHTGGMGDVFDLPAFAQRRTQLWSLADWLPLVAETRPQFPPGERWSYSNAGFLVAASVLERLTGDGWEALVERHVFAPAGMAATGYPPLVGVDAPPDLAVPWSEELGGDARGVHVVRGMPAGGGVSTVGDLHRFAVWVLAQPLREELWHAVAYAEEHAKFYGLGFYVDGAVVGHDGAFWGIDGQLWIDRERGWIVAALANADPPTAGDAVAALLAAC